MKTNSTITVIKGDLATDDRGTLRFVNDFEFSNIKRFYQVENHNINTIRAFHGHLKEAKYVYVSKGSIILCAVVLDNISRPDRNAKLERIVLTSTKPTIVYIPPGYANGFKALEKGTVVIFFSTVSIAETKDDDYRFPYDYWGTSIWEIENR